MTTATKMDTTFIFIIIILMDNPIINVIINEFQVNSVVSFTL